MQVFIEAVKSHPCLWNPLRSDYRDMVVKDEAWQTVVEEINMPHIRNNSFEAILRKRAASAWHRARDSPNTLLAAIGSRYCCPILRHWNKMHIENDMENYIKYKLVGGMIKLKKGIVPHKFKCQQVKEDKPPRSAVLKRKRIELIPKKKIYKDETRALEKPEEIHFASCEDEIVIGDPISYGNDDQCLEISKRVQSAKMEWKKLRDNHRDALKRAKLGKNKLLPAQITTWKYAKVMQFLEPHMKYRITENIDTDPSTSSDPNNELQNQYFSDQDVSTSDQDKRVKVAKKRKMDRKEASSQEHLNTKYDGLQAFFNFMLDSVRAMPPSVQTQVKKKIFHVVAHAEEELAQKDVYLETDHDNTDDDDVVNISKVEIKTEHLDD